MKVEGIKYWFILQWIFYVLRNGSASLRLALCRLLCTCSHGPRMQNACSPKTYNHS